MAAVAILLLIFVPATTIAIAMPENNAENAEAANSSVLSANTNAADETAEESPKFEAIFAIAGLLAVAYLVGKQRED